MHTSRRSTLKSVGLVLGGGGMELLRSGAADTEARQALQIGFVPDRNADLQIQPGIESTEHITVEDSADHGVALSIANLNRGARTRFDDLLAFTNTGANTITAIEAEVTQARGPIDVQAHGESQIDVEPGDSITALGLTIDTTALDGESQLNGSEITITLRVETDA